MAKTVDSIEVGTWLLDPATVPEYIELVEFTLPEECSRQLQSMNGSHKSLKSHYNAPTKTFPEIAALFSPDIAFINSRSPIKIYYLKDRYTPKQTKQYLWQGFRIWLNISYPEAAAELRNSIASEVLKEQNWQQLEIPTTCTRSEGRVCPEGNDSLLYDAIIASALDALSNQKITFPDATSRRLVRKTPSGNLYRGSELVVYPPTYVEKKGWWSEYIVLSAVALPEQDSIGVVANVSVRNWRPLNYQTYDKKRTLDIFYPSQSEAQHLYHTSFKVHAQKKGESLEARWGKKKEQRFVDILTQLKNVDLPQNLLNEPLCGENGLWVLPRASTSHKDRFLAGGVGVGWPGRKHLLTLLDGYFDRLGLVRAPNLLRCKKVSQSLISLQPTLTTITNPMATTPDKAEECKNTQKENRNALISFSGIADLPTRWDLIYFGAQEASFEQLIKETLQLFGTAHIRPMAWGKELQYDDGFILRLVNASAGPLAEALPCQKDIPLNPAWEHLNEAQRNSIQKKQLDKLLEKRDGEMQSIIDSVAQKAELGEVVAAVLEMDSSLKDDDRIDPFLRARKALGSRGIIPQVVLCGPDENENKFRSALLDCFRAIGVPPTQLPAEDWTLAAFTVIQRNQKYQGGGKIASQSIPLATRYNGRLLEVALPDKANQSPVWLPYHKAAIKILQGDYGCLRKNNDPRAEEFFLQCLKDLNQNGDSLVIVEAESIRGSVKTFSSGSAEFDQLSLCGRLFKPVDFPHLRLVKFNHENNKLPSYYHEEDRGYISGLFEWPGSRRTWYSIRQKPATMQAHKSVLLTSRRQFVDGKPSRTQQDKKIVPLNEICTLFVQPGDDPLQLALLTAKLRKYHVQYDGDTVLPFPLHELQKLGGYVTG
jgi:hypothetical protein